LIEEVSDVINCNKKRKKLFGEGKGKNKKKMMRGS